MFVSLEVKCQQILFVLYWIARDIFLEGILVPALLRFQKGIADGIFMLFLDRLLQEVGGLALDVATLRFDHFKTIQLFLVLYWHFYLREGMGNGSTLFFAVE